MSILSVVHFQLALKFFLTQKIIRCVAMTARSLGTVTQDPDHAPPLRASTPLWGCTLNAYFHGDLRRWLALRPQRDQGALHQVWCREAHQDNHLAVERCHLLVVMRMDLKQETSCLLAPPRTCHWFWAIHVLEAWYVLCFFTLCWPVYHNSWYRDGLSCVVIYWPVGAYWDDQDGHSTF
jgi:hypothetical protein